MKKNEQLQATCSGYTNEGLGVIKKDHYPLFVKGLLKGEQATIAATLCKKTYGYGRIVSLHTISDARITPICPYAKQCGGCQLQHMNYDEQLQFKYEKVENVMRRIAKIDTPIFPVLGMKDPYHYRNKSQIPVGEKDGDIQMGFYRINSNVIIDAQECLIQSTMINQVWKEVKDLFKIYQNHQYFRHVLIKHAFHTKEIMVVFIVKQKKIPYLEELVEDLCTRIPLIKSIILNINTRNDNVILGEKEYVLYGEKRIKDKIGDNIFSISSKSFYQVNPIQTKVLYETALQYANLSGNETVLDLYCGVGTISMFLARHAKKVIGIEIVEDAIVDAKNNALMNNIHNIDFICSDAASYASKLSNTNMKIDVVVVDPPRKGCDMITLDSIVKIQPQRIVYVSCDPATLARDIQILENKGYKCEKIQPVDMFPQTHHVESIVLLSHKSPDSTINVKVEFGEGEGKVPLDAIAERAKKYQPKPKITYKMIQEYVEKKYGFKVHTAYIAEVKRSLGLTMYDAPNAVEELKHPRKYPSKEKVEAIKDALKYYEVI